MYDQPAREQLALELRAAFLEAEWTVEGLSEAGVARLDRWPAWITALAMTVVATHRVPPVPPDDLWPLILAFLESHAGAEEDRRGAPGLMRLVAAPPPPRPLAERFGWPVPAIASPAELADLLELSDGQLAWLADVRGWERSVPHERLRNYRYRTLPRAGGVPRLIEAPKGRLKEIQRRLLRDVLDQVPAHPAAHGFVAGRSAVSHADVHAGQPAVLRLDLQDFFASVPAGRVHRIWRSLGYEPSVSGLLTGLSTNVVPAAIWQVVAAGTPADAVQARFRLGRQLATPHLPQGAPTSPALANLAAYRLDRRLSGLASASGLRYSRYADDLTFSGPQRLLRASSQFAAAAARIVRSEGFTPNAAKTVLLSDAGRQSVCGIVVNAHPNISRVEYDALKAALHNAARHGPASQSTLAISDFRAYLVGRVSWVQAVNPHRGAKLREILERIDWGGALQTGSSG